MKTLNRRQGRSRLCQHIFREPLFRCSPTRTSFKARVFYLLYLFFYFFFLRHGNEEEWLKC